MIITAKLAGRCANGNERGKGAVVHLVECRDPQYGINDYAKALCGKTHGPRSAGWSMDAGPTVTCPKCAKLQAPTAP
jgi:hypothetical protein